jgi:hypothetical protein
MPKRRCMPSQQSAQIVPRSPAPLQTPRARVIHPAGLPSTTSTFRAPCICVGLATRDPRWWVEKRRSKNLTTRHATKASCGLVSKSAHLAPRTALPSSAQRLASFRCTLVFVLVLVLALLGSSPFSSSSSTSSTSSSSSSLASSVSSVSSLRTKERNLPTTHRHATKASALLCCRRRRRLFADAAHPLPPPLLAPSQVMVRVGPEAVDLTMESTGRGLTLVPFSPQPESFWPLKSAKVPLKMCSVEPKSGRV